MEACAQLREYRDYFELEQNGEAVEEAYGLRFFRPNMMVVIGKRSDYLPVDLQKAAGDIAQLSITTYDDLLPGRALEYHAKLSLLINDFGFTTAGNECSADAGVIHQLEGQDDPDAAGALDLDSGPEMGTSPGSSNGPEPGRRPCPGTPWRSRPPRPRPPGRRRIRLPGASILYLGITLSDERGEGERAHCRRSVANERSADPVPLSRRSGGSGTGL